VLPNDMKQFDQIFREQAKKAFSTYNADQLAEEGWNLFVSKRKGKKRFAIVLPLWAKAASVALLVSAGGLFIYRTLNEQTESFTSQDQFVSKPDEETQIPLVSDRLRPLTQQSPDKSVIDILPVKIYGQTVSVVEALVVKDIDVKSEIISSGQDSVGLVDQAANVEYITGINPGADVKKENSITEVADEIPAGRKTSLIAGFSGMMSGIEDVMANSPGGSVGFYIERKLKGRLSVRPGLALAKHTYSSTNVFAGKAFMNSTTGTGNMTGSVVSFENKLDMVTVEVPVNLVYTIIDRAKSSLFVSAGVSTMIYLDQNFSSSFTNVYTEQKLDLASGNTYVETRTQDVSVESDENAFSHVDFFGLTNFSAGYSLPLKMGGNMIIEPFVQLPVSDLTSFNVRIRYAGLSFKFRFGQ